MIPAKVMIVEDERIIALDLKNQLKNLGYEVVAVVANGEDALAQAAATSPHLALMDVHLEGDLDGIETAQALLERHGTPSVLLTAYTDDDKVRRAGKGLTYGYLVKPWDPRELHATIQVTLARATAYRRVRESEDRFQSMSRMTSDYYWETDAGHRFTEAVYGFGHRPGVAGLMQIGKARWEIPSVTPDQAGWDSLRRTMDSHLPFRNFELSRIGDGTEERFFEVAGEPMFDDHGAFHGYRGVGREITERKLAERRLLNAQDHIERLNAELESRIAERTRDLGVAMTDLESFAYTVAHDLRAPLRALSGFCGILIEDHGGSLEAEPQRLLGVIDANARRMAALIDGLLEFSRLGRRSVTRSTVDMEAMARDVLTEMRLAGRYGAHEVQISPMPPCEADPLLMRAVWTNLIDNAAKYSSKAASPRISLGYDAATGAYFVADNGVGFDMQYSNKLFTVFSRLHTEAEFPGTGAGLAIVQRILQRHGGKAWAESAPGSGATFRFTPRASSG